MADILSLDKLPKGLCARVVAIAKDVDGLEAKLREIGFAEGDEVELMARGPLGGRPLSVRLNRTIIALRKNEAALVQIATQPAEARS